MACLLLVAGIATHTIMPTLMAINDINIFSQLTQLYKLRVAICIIAAQRDYAAETLETQLAEARSRNSQLQGEVEKLNDTVFSKTFRAPSAWAEREVKYKMEKKDWDTQVTCCCTPLYPSAYSSGGRTAGGNTCWCSFPHQNSSCLEEKVHVRQLPVQIMSAHFRHQGSGYNHWQ